ncbi:4-hydroxy-tetrahydrodipicolinate synthase [Oceanimonas baumannii]|uniref:4-hydroxy-tetrahydrodipicolinate synthase n=1 Tax=Oceanimonas baumannii TaxID=129578 RepID=A0A235CJS2_9GAMM|nr:4-hydroxy-tetrahydrodipicolinate synthase [Oceanimonas baumannii]OYD24634.1 4-hydroxy-tetrahydrodipicolinate synthase [Oceanimonas baumannii]TDW59376.1 4-hydroxy-tetrahydrodipicolinate synthase [Oceanimonas baumannii]
MFRGSLVALLTPFDGDRLDEAALRRLVDWHIDEGTHGLVPVGTTGESPTLTHDEHCRVIEIVSEQAAGRVPVIAGAGSNNPVEAIEYSVCAQQAGANATLHVAGYYNRPNQEGLYAHFKMLHDATELPIIVYNIPPRAVVDILPATLARMAELPRVVGVKDATGDLNRPWAERQLIKKPFSWLSGEDGTAVSYNVGGGQGCISVTANVAPKLCAQLQDLTLNGKWEEARALQDKLLPLHQVLFAEPNPACPKYALSLLGMASEHCRVPVVPLQQDTKARIRRVMEELELI